MRDAVLACANADPDAGWTGDCGDHPITMEVLSDLIRTAFIPAEGKKFIVCDYSAIEARVLAWLAEEGWRETVFREGGDIYAASASAMFHVPVEKHGINAELRQKGKVAELALGYGGGAEALKHMHAADYGLKEEELEGLKKSWRAANPRIVQFWYDIDRAARTAVEEMKIIRCGRIEMEGWYSMLFIRLPSGRKMSYFQPEIADGRFGKVIRYLGRGRAGPGRRRKATARSLWRISFRGSRGIFWRRRFAGLRASRAGAVGYTVVLWRMCTTRLSWRFQRGPLLRTLRGR